MKVNRDLLFRIPAETVFKDYGLRPGEKITFAKQKIFYAKPFEATIEREYPRFFTVKVVFRDKCHPGETNSYVTAINKVSLFLNEVMIRDGNGMLVI